MSDAGLKALLQLEKTMVVSHLAKRSIVAYSREVRFMIEHYPDKDPMDWTEDLVIDYIHHLITEKQASRSKCHMAAQSMAYFFRHVIGKPFQTPGKYQLAQAARSALQNQVDGVCEIARSIARQGGGVFGTLYPENSY